MANIAEDDELLHFYPHLLSTGRSRIREQSETRFRYIGDHGRYGCHRARAMIDYGQLRWSIVAGPTQLGSAFCAGENRDL